MKSRKSKVASTTPDKPKHAGGRPANFKTPELLWEAFKKYKLDMESQGKPLTVSGFCNSVDSYREMIAEYSHKPEFTNTIKKIYSLIENDIEVGILTNQWNPTAGIFNLKNNFGWKDKTELSGDQQNPLTIISNIPSKK